VIARSRQTLVNGLLVASVFATTFFYRFNTLGGALGGFTNDEFGYLARGRQIQSGELPFRDFNDPGWILTDTLSGAAQWLGGYNLRSEALLTIGMLSLGAAITFVLARRAAGSTLAALLALVVHIALDARHYNYPKIALYAAGLALAWAYVDWPRRGRLAALAPEAVTRSFPLQQADVGLTGAALLVSGPRARAGLAIAESLFARRPHGLPLEWVARDFLATLYPRPWDDLIVSQAAAQRVDPLLFTAIVREESRFDPDATSPAAAQGLTQLVLPTARRLARSAGLPEVGLAELRLPALSVTLGAAYLAELGQRFQGEPTAIAAAYNAGEDQTALWMRTCLSSDPEELLAKIGFGETRSYVTRVLEARNAYRLLAAAP